MKTGLQLYSIKDISEEKGIKTALKAAAVCGYDGVEFAGYFGLPAEEMKEELEKNNLVAYGSHIGINLLREDTDACIKYLKKIGAPTACIPCVSAFDDEEKWVAFAKEANEIGKRFAQEGIKFGYHNHWVEFEKRGEKRIIDIIMENSEPENLFFELDTRHCVIAGAKPSVEAAKFAGRIPVLHARDTDMTNDVAVGSGVVDFKKVVENGDGIDIVIVENENFGCNLEELRQSAKYIKENL